VTFQLYWNMMNNAYQNLQGLVTSFTRSAAGAEKVFSLWDNTPDIDPNDGAAINWDVEGEIEFKSVDYFYQMRPDNMVLSGLDLKVRRGKTQSGGAQRQF
jgi:ATP-binding cassette subfamily B protein